jgi:tetratricopeptide (TPR) repeat protein
MWQKSDSLYEVSIEKHPDNSLLLNNYSYSLSERGIQLEKALSMVKKALKSEPDNGAYLDTIGWIYYKMGDYKAAQDYIKKALQLRDDNPEVIEHLGDVYYKMNLLDEARINWEKALELDPQNIELKQKIDNL